MSHLAAPNSIRKAAGTYHHFPPETVKVGFLQGMQKGSGYRDTAVAYSLKDTDTLEY